MNLQLFPCCRSWHCYQRDLRNAASFATLALQFSPRQPECSQVQVEEAEQQVWTEVVWGGGWIEGHFFLQHRTGKEKGTLFLQQGTGKSLVSYTKLLQEKELSAHVIEHPWNSASSLCFSSWISDQRDWGLEGSGKIIAGKYRLNEITWRHSALKKKKKKKQHFNFLSKLQ